MALGNYGWRPQHPDHRDLVYKVDNTAILPQMVDLRGQMPPVYDQGQLGSCTANAIGAAMEYERVRQGESDFMPSRLFIYYNERSMEGTVHTDSGAVIRDGIKSVNSRGVCSEDLWPYDTSMFTIRPPRRCYVSAKTDVALQYEAIQTLGDLKSALANGLAVVFGFTVYESFESAQVASTGAVPMPGRGESVLGGHAVLAVGYDEQNEQVIVRNSWGPSWGDKGYFYMPYQYMTGPANTLNNAKVNGAYLASDFWAIQKVK